MGHHKASVPQDCLFMSMSEGFICLRWTRQLPALHCEQSLAHGSQTALFSRSNCGSKPRQVCSAQLREDVESIRASAILWNIRRTCGVCLLRETTGVQWLCRELVGVDTLSCGKGFSAATFVSIMNGIQIPRTNE